VRSQWNSLCYVSLSLLLVEPERFTIWRLSFDSCKCQTLRPPAELGVYLRLIRNCTELHCHPSLASFDLLRWWFLAIQSGSVRHSSTTIRATSSPNHSASSLILTLNRWSWKRVISTIELERPRTKTLPPTYQSGLNGWTSSALPLMKYPYVSLHQCNLFLPASTKMWVRSSTKGMSRDEVSMSRLSLSHLHSCISSSSIRNNCLRVSSSIIMWEQSTLLFQAANTLRATVNVISGEILAQELPSDCGAELLRLGISCLWVVFRVDVIASL